MSDIITWGGYFTRVHTFNPEKILERPKLREKRARDGPRGRGRSRVGRRPKGEMKEENEYWGVSLCLTTPLLGISRDLMWNAIIPSRIHSALLLSFHLLKVLGHFNITALKNKPWKHETLGACLHPNYRKRWHCTQISRSK